MNDLTARRDILKAAVGLGLGAASGLMPLSTQAVTLSRLEESDPAAVALGYVTDARRVDTRKFTAYIKGSNCENCMQLQGKAGDHDRPCALFPGKTVAAAGWCSGWTAEM